MHAVDDAYGMANFLCGTTFIQHNAVFSLISLLDYMGFAHDDIRIMTDESPWNLPTKENIVSPACWLWCPRSPLYLFS